MLKDEARTSQAILTATGTFPMILKAIISTLNAILRDVESSSSGYGLRIDLSKGECGESLSWLFTETVVIEIIEAVEYKSVDMVAPLLGATVDTMCGFEPDASVTKAFTSYVYMVELM